MKTKKPPGYAAFNDLTKLLVQVPKREIDAQSKQYDKAKQKRRAKRKAK